jgi:7-carboxy-7-deazaguanine synthase
MSNTYRVNEIFNSVQGEGVRAGTANIFLRFSGCNLTCNVNDQGFDCDTEFVSGRTLTLEQLLAELKEVAPNANAIVLTGGEPSLQVDGELIRALRGAGYYLAIETNGTKELPPGIDWITVSPKTAEHTLRQLVANEVKYVRVHGQGLPKPSVKADYYLLSPGCESSGQFNPRDLQWVVNMVKENPTWRLSLQTHKLLKVR